jgi:AcrR family transcriptional regulator
LFARDGYSRANVDAIAAVSGVSNRTIYNHFKDKAQLFEAVIQESSRRVAEIQIAIIDRHLSKIVELEADLVEFGLDWLAVLDSDVAPHFALVRQVNAELEHVPRAAIEAWQDAGPRRVRRELAGRLCRLAERERLRVPEPDRAAVHLMLLISAENLRQPNDQQEVVAMVTAGVRAFLRGYEKGR